MLLLGVALVELLVRNQPLGGQDERRGRAQQGAAKRESEELRLVPERVQRVDDHEGDGADGRQHEQCRDDELTALIRRHHRHDPLPLSGREGRSAASGENQDDRRQQGLETSPHA